MVSLPPNPYITDMHPILKDRRSLIVYLAAWLTLALMLTAMLALPGRVSWAAVLAFTLPLMFVYAFITLSAWYICKAFPLGVAPLARILVTNCLAAVFSSSLWVLAGFGWVAVLNTLQEGMIPPAWHIDSLPLLGSSGIVLFLLASAVSYLIAMFEASREAERNALQLRGLARESELKSLRAQIDPHFLFNSLNSISALTTVDPPAARAMTVKLAEFLRLSLRYGALDTISLTQEISLTTHFLAIEKIRHGNRLAITVEIDDAAADCRIAPLLLQPLVENAIRHGIDGLLGGGTIGINATRTGDQLHLCIENPVDAGALPKEGTGVGLDNVRRRIAGLYGTDGRITTLRDASRFTVRIDIPVRTPEEN